MRSDAPEPTSESPDDAVVAGVEPRQALRAMDPAKRLVLVLYWYLDLAVDEIADIIGTSADGAESRLRRATTDLKRRFPDFLDESHAWVLDANTPLLLMTSDGGQTWNRHGLPRFHYFSCQGKFGPTTCSSEGIITASFINPNEGWIALYYTPDKGSRNYVQIQHTANGGKTWGVVNPNLMGVNRAEGPEQLTFVDQSNGFIWTGTALLRTTDGGHTWSRVHVSYSP